MCKKTITLLLVSLLSVAPVAKCFVLLGPGAAEGNTIKVWQTRGANAGWSIGYDLPGDIGAPVDPLEFYRWNVPVITYAFDDSFIRYFGTNGIKAIDEAFDLLNDLPAASKMSPTLSEFPLNTLRQNYEAAQFGLIDLKSVAMTFILEELGLAQADRWVWALHHREVIDGAPLFPGAYDVIRYNIDPATLQRSSYINETLYTYEIQQFPPPGPQTPYADAYEFTIPIDTIPNSPVTSFGAFTPGNFFTGFTRDDIGALRYLWNPRNVVAESLLPGTIPGGGKAFSPYIGTNFLGSNAPAAGTNALTAALRGGVNKVRFRKVYFDSFLGGTFTPITNSYKDRVTLGNSGRFSQQSVLRPIATPDFIFTVEDINQFTIFRTTTASWINNDLLTPFSNLGGPGVIRPPVTISFNLIFPVVQNQTPDFVTEPNAFFFGGTWASFDGTTNAPIIYPQYLNFTIQDLRNGSQPTGGF